MILFIFSFGIIKFVVPDPNIFLWIAVFVAHAFAGNSNCFKTFLANGLSTFSIKNNKVFSNYAKKST